MISVRATYLFNDVIGAFKLRQHWRRGSRESAESFLNETIYLDFPLTARNSQVCVCVCMCVFKHDIKLFDGDHHHRRGDSKDNNGYY